MTVFQSGYVFRNIVIGKLNGYSAVTVGIMSAVICVLQCTYFFSINKRAEIQLNNLIKTGKIPEDFWKAQHLSISDDVLTLKCGSTRYEYDCAYFTGADELADILILNFRKDRSVHQLLVPKKAIGSADNISDFISLLNQSKDESIKSAFPCSMEENNLNSDYSVDFEYDISSFSSDYARGSRKIYLTPAGWSLSFIAKLAGAGFLLYNVFAGRVTGTAYTVFAVLISVVLLFQLLVAFTPISRIIAKEHAVSLFKGLEKMNCRLEADDQSLRFKGDTFDNTIPIADVKAVEKDSRNCFIYLKNGSSISIPITEGNKGAVSRIFLFLDLKAESNRKKSGFKL